MTTKKRLISRWKRQHKELREAYRRYYNDFGIAPRSIGVKIGKLTRAIKKLEAERVRPKKRQTSATSPLEDFLSRD